MVLFMEMENIGEETSLGRDWGKIKVQFQACQVSVFYLYPWGDDTQAVGYMCLESKVKVKIEDLNLEQRTT